MIRIIDRISVIISNNNIFSGRCSKMPLLFIIVLYLTTVLIHSSSSSSQVVTFSPSTDLRHLAVDPQSGTVYVGAVNHIYQLNSHLTLVVDVTTGPMQDNKDCADFDNDGNLDCDSTEFPTSFINDYNQVTVFCDGVAIVS